MHSDFISKELLKQVLTDIQHFLAQPKMSKRHKHTNAEQGNKLNKQQQKPTGC